MGEWLRPAWAEVDLAALRHNVGVLARAGAPASLCAVVKAGAYGHGAVPLTRAALAAGASRVAVATVEEGIELRDAGIDAPVLVLSEPPPGAAAAAVAAALTPTVATPAAASELAAVAARVGIPTPVHVKVDTGMHRVGAAPGDLPGLVAAVCEAPWLRVEAVWTHLAVADSVGEEDQAFTTAQLSCFDMAVASLPSRPPLLHAANSAGALLWPGARYDLVRCGIALYGVAPSDDVAAASPEAAGLRPVLSLHARVSAVRTLAAGERPSYGRCRALPDDAVVATVPLGYADGVTRALFGAGAEVLIGGRRRPLAGMVTMDQVMVDCGPDDRVSVGDEVVLLGRQGAEEVTAAEWAGLLGTIPYEVLCGIGPRVERRYVGAGGDGPGPAAAAAADPGASPGAMMRPG